MWDRKPRGPGTIWGVDEEGLKWAVGDEEHDKTVTVSGLAFCFGGEEIVRVHVMDEDAAKIKAMHIDFRRCILVLLEDLSVEKEADESPEAGADPVQEP